MLRIKCVKLNKYSEEDRNMSDNDNHNGNDTEDKGFDPGRRRFVKNTGMVIGGVAGGSLLGGLITNQFQTETAPEETTENKKQEAYTEARMFFTRFEDFVVLEQATERIYPEDDNGPGAIALGVPYFIDKQLYGYWGKNAKNYRRGPYRGLNPSTDLSSLNRGEIFIAGLRKMNELSRDRFDTSFDEADEDQQIEILQDFHDGKVDMKAVASDSFFELLRETTLEGVYSDPLYGGNRNMEGWKMKEFPGSVSSYANIIEEEDFVKMDPVSLTDYQQK